MSADSFEEGAVPPFLYGTHYSTPGYVMYWLLRAAPAHMVGGCGMVGSKGLPPCFYCMMSCSLSLGSFIVRRMLNHFHLLNSCGSKTAGLMPLTGSSVRSGSPGRVYRC